jgi:hypothetical protein
MSSYNSRENLRSTLTDESEERSTLFQYDKAEMFSFEELSDNMKENQSQGRLLGHGKLEVFQLHQKKVSYLQCGSVVYPIMPKLKILKISRNQFIIPLSNPERYWRIVVETSNQSTINDLEAVLKSICQFRNLFIQPAPLSKPIGDTKPLALPHSKSSASLTSISTAVACLNLESDTSTFVEDKLMAQLPPLQRTDSKASSLDIALDSFFEEPDVTTYYTPDPTFLADQSLQSSRFSPVAFETSSVLPKRQPQSTSSRSASLYQSESSWMDPSDDLNTSTPNTQRYIRLNLDPMIRESATKRDKRVITEPILSTNSIKKAGYRYSSYDVYNILKESTIDEVAESDTSFKGFLKSFF